MVIINLLVSVTGGLAFKTSCPVTLGSVTGVGQSSDTHYTCLSSWLFSQQSTQQCCDPRCGCVTANNPCDKVKCRPMEECSVDRNGQPTCKCPHYCEPVVRYVCGNDSVTYDNECALRKKTCEAHQGPYVVVQHQGHCGELLACSSVSSAQHGILF